jgi:hypothetical protein
MNIIELAREAGFTDHEAFEGYECNAEELERFAALVREQVESEWIETNKALAKEIIERQWVDLTDDELFVIADKVNFDGELMKINHDRGMPSIAELYVKAAIASFKDKNK